MHGGKAPQAKAAAARREAEAEAGRLLEKLRLWNPDAAPITDAVSAMQRLAGSDRATLDTLGALLNRWVEQDVTCSGCGRPASDPPAVLLAAFQRQDRNHAQLLEAMERLGIAQRFVQVESARVELIAVALGRVFEVLELSDEQRAVGGRVLLDELRAGETGGSPPELGGAA